MTITKPLILNVGPKEFANGLTYTGSSRTPDFSKLAFEPMPSFNRILAIFNRTRFKEKEAEIVRRQEIIDGQQIAKQVQEQEAVEHKEMMEQEEPSEVGEDSEDLVLSQLSNISL